MKKGFTLIELLAVIVILAIIAVIAVPIVLNIIEETKESSNLRSAEMYLNGIQNAIMLENMKSSANFKPTSCTIINDGNLDCLGKDGILKIDVNGEKPIDGNIRYEEGKIVEARLKYKSTTVIMNDNLELVIQDEKFLSTAILKNNKIQKDTTINFNNISSDTNGKGLYYTNKNTQDNKTTYYFRGAVNNNYVKFGTEKTCSYKGNEVIYLNGIEDGVPSLDIHPSEEKCLSTTAICDVGSFIKDTYGDDYRYVIGNEQMAQSLGGNQAVCSMFGGTIINEKATYDEVDVYWKIIRINEDGSTRLIYQGNYPTIGRVEATIGESVFNSDSSDNAHVGYMYGKAGSTTYEETHTNTNDSTIKIALDKWYENNLNSYSKYIADTGFCNDRSIHTAQIHFDDTKKGYGTNFTNYSPYTRIYDLKTPQFECPQKNDLFTVSNAKGNQDLTYPIGLITIDEAMYAGGVGSIYAHTYQSNLDFYLNNGVIYWTMSGSDYISFYVESNPTYKAGNFVVSDHLEGYQTAASVYVRPVINLKSNVEIIDGDGTITKPYVIKINNRKGD